ncbi:YlmC/YmxH family sporulation protein, partial [Bacillus sp. JJ1503]
INAVIIGGTGKVLGFFGRDEDMIIPWKNILKIGEDVILVRYQNGNMEKDVDEDV